VNRRARWLARAAERGAAPERVDDREATCALALDGVDPVRVSHGATTLQALVLALRLGRMRLDSLVSTGGRILEPERGEDLAVDAMLGG
jgi:hypothetical protein